MAKKKDPIQRAEEVGQQIFEVVSSGLADIVSRLQELTSTLDKKVDEQFRTITGEPPPAPKPVAKSDKSGKGDSSKSAAASKQAKGSKKSGPKSKAAKAGAKGKGKNESKPKPSRGSKATAASGPTRDELYSQAQDLNIAGRSKMSKSQLAAAIEKARAS